jgi:hypothetical protein
MHSIQTALGGVAYGLVAHTCSWLTFAKPLPKLLLHLNVATTILPSMGEGIKRVWPFIP